MTVTETVPAWWLGKHPEKRWIIASYNSEFAAGFGRRNRLKCLEHNPEIFPGFELRDTPCNNTEFQTTKGGGVYCVGLTAGITGHPAECFIIDDPIKTRAEADSPTIKDNIWGEYLSSVKTRLHPGSKLICIQTRWAEDDLFGRLAKEEKNVEIINLPCECEDAENDPLGRQVGDTLVPELGRGRAWLEDFKAVYKSKEGSRAWAALYQGNPIDLEGGMFKREWWKYYTEEDIQNLPYQIISVDASFKDGESNDYVSVQVWGKRNSKYYLLDLINEHLNFVDTLDAIRQMRSKYPETLFVLVEDKANGTAVINVLSQEMDGVIPVQPLSGKVSRANAVAPAIERGDVYLPKFAVFTKPFIDQCAAFPTVAHDDMVDAMTQALNRMIYVDADVIAPQHIVYKHWTDDMFEDYENADDELKIYLISIWGYPDNDGDFN